MPHCDGTALGPEGRADTLSGSQRTCLLLRKVSYVIYPNCRHCGAQNGVQVAEQPRLRSKYTVTYFCYRCKRWVVKQQVTMAPQSP